MKYLIEVKNVEKTYPKTNTKNRLKYLASILFNKVKPKGIDVLKDINLKIKKGESLAIIGKNGAGKSTLLKIISKVLEPTNGEVKINGSIGALLELGSGFHLDYTGRQNLKMAATLAGMTAKEISEKIDRMIDFAEIGSYIDHPVKSYSTGMVVRLGFSVITVTQPDILITDEVLAVGDNDFQRKCISWINNYLMNGGTLLLVSHSMYHVQKLCKHAIWIENGKIKKSGNAFKVSQEYQNKYEMLVEQRAIETNQDVTNYHVKDIKIMNDNNFEISSLCTNEKLKINVRVYSPDGRVPGLAVGIVRKDIDIYGTISDLHKPNPVKVDEFTYEYNIEFPEIKLLPADYNINIHAMDPECLRIIDTHKKKIRIHSDTLELGTVILKTIWH